MRNADQSLFIDIGQVDGLEIGDDTLANGRLFQKEDFLERRNIMVYKSPKSYMMKTKIKNYEIHYSGRHNLNMENESITVNEYGKYILLHHKYFQHTPSLEIRNGKIRIISYAHMSTNGIYKYITLLPDNN